MRFEYPLIGVMIFLVVGILALIAIDPDDVIVPKVSESQPSSLAVPAPGFEDVPEMIVQEEPESEIIVSEPRVEAPPAAIAPFTGTISVPEGSGIPGCEEMNECFIPADVTINVGETVTWSNDDTAAHTVTSGIAVDGPDGVFDSSLFMAGKTFQMNFDEVGTYDYFCMVHPWMKGIIHVV